MDLALLSGIRTPQDLKRIPIDRLPELAAEMRWAICNQIRKSGGQCREVLAVLVIKDCMFGAVWAYPVRGKGLEAAPELVDHILGDLDASGFDRARLFVKNDQEPSITEIQAEIGRRRRALEADGTAELYSEYGLGIVGVLVDIIGDELAAAAAIRSAHMRRRGSRRTHSRAKINCEVHKTFGTRIESLL